jgi:pimeloyl-ACP methyl ester carboxylesterase
VESGRAAGGASWRIGTARGTLWAGRPAGFRPGDAGVCIYLHGYFTTVDQAVSDHRLAEQFAASGRNALFIVAEAPAWNGEDGVWPDLDELLAETFRRIGLKPPAGPVVVVGHSGAFRPILSWLGHARLEEVLLLDGLYRGEAQFKGWLQVPGLGARRRLVLVSDETFPAAEALVATIPGAALAVIPKAGHMSNLEQANAFNAALQRFLESA